MDIGTRISKPVHSGLVPLVQQPQPVVITGIDISIWSLAQLIVKFAIAMIPASLLMMMLYGAAFAIWFKWIA